MTTKSLETYYHYFQDHINLNQNLLSKWLPYGKSPPRSKHSDHGRDTLYAVGNNGFGELGFGHCEPIPKLTKHKLQNIKSIACSNNYNIFIDHHDNYFASGYNEYGQCGFNKKEKTIHLKPIPYTFSIDDFKSSIKHLKICVSISGNATFWITKTHKLYVNGGKSAAQLGSVPVNYPFARLSSIAYPKIIHHIYHPLDVAVAEDYSLILCSINITLVLYNWIRLHNIYHTPTDIVKLMESFYGNTNLVFSASNRPGAGQGRDNTGLCFGNWTQIEALSNVEIIKIATGDDYSMFLDGYGTLWTCGRNEAGQLGLGMDKKECVYVPTPITYFVENKIKIKDVCCGAWHNLAIDYDNKVYGWGHNMHGQCGIGNTINVYTPQVIAVLEGLRIEKIGCGAVHSYCKTADGTHFLFGSNSNFECVMENEDEVNVPHMINDCVYQQTGAKYIKDVFLSDRGTFFLLNDFDEDQNEDIEEDADQNEDDWVFCHIESASPAPK